MDSENEGSDSMDREDLLEVEVPKILHQAIRDVFPIFANMLDIKSFMELSMANKEMHKFCMESKEINIDVKESTFSFGHSLEPREIRFDTYHRPGEQYLTYMRRQQCSITLGRLNFWPAHWLQDKDKTHTVGDYRNILEQIGVKKIDEICIKYNVTSWDDIISIVESYHVQKLTIDHYDVPDDILHSLLQLKLDYFHCQSEVPAQLLLDSPIRNLNLLNVINCSREVFLPLLWKIQTGPLISLVMGPRAVNWDVYDTLNYGHDDPLPDERPLIFRRLADWEGEELWFLHWHGGVTKCTVDGRELVVRKCSAEDFPPILKSQELVHNLLKQKRTIDCLRSHYRSFFKSRHVYELTADDPLPEERPFIIKGPGYDDNYWLIEEDDIITSYDYTGHRASCTSYEMKSNWPSQCFNKTLRKKIFRKMLQTNNVRALSQHSFFVAYGFPGLFDNFTVLPFDFWSDLPAERPLIFDRSWSEQHMSELHELMSDRRFILHADGGVTQCKFEKYECTEDYYIRFRECSLNDIPSVLISSELLKNRLLKVPIYQEIIHRMELETLQGSFEDMASFPFDYSGPLSKHRPLIFKHTEIDNGIITSEEYWLLNGCIVTRCKWESGRTVFSVAEPQTSPKALVKGLALEFLQKQWDFSEHEMFISRRDSAFFNKYSFLPALKEFTTVPFDSIETLPADRPLVFQREYQACYENGPVVLVDDQNVVICNCEDEFFSVDHCRPCDLPSALITVNGLIDILCRGPSVERDYHFKICLEMYLEMFKEYKVLPYDYSGNFPLINPVVVEWSGDGGDEKRWFFNSVNNTVMMCSWCDGHARFSMGIGSQFPPILQKLYICDYIENFDEHKRHYWDEDSTFEADVFRDCVNAMKSFSSTFRGPLPDERPLVFKEPEELEAVVLLADGRLIQCDLREGSAITCDPLKFPQILMTAEHFRRILMESVNGKLEYDGMSMEVFLGGLDSFKTFPCNFSDPLPNDRPLVFKSKESEEGAEEGEERWLFMEDNVVTKCVWKNGKTLLAPCSPRDFPIAVTMEIAVRYLEDDDLKDRSGLFLDLNSIRICLEEFKTLPYDYSGPLPEERPLIFEKSEIQHECGAPAEGGCSCSEQRLLFWIVHEDDQIHYRFDHATWNEVEPNKLVFLEDLFLPLPLAIVSRDFLKSLLERRWLLRERKVVDLYGDFDDFLECFEGYTTLEWNEDIDKDPRSQERPLVVKERAGDDQKAVFWFYSSHGERIKCIYCDGYAQLHIEPRRDVYPFLQ